MSLALELEMPRNSNLYLVDFGATGEVGTSLEMSVDIKLSLAVLSQEVGALLSPFCAHMYLKTVNPCASLCLEDYSLYPKNLYLGPHTSKMRRPEG